MKIPLFIRRFSTFVSLAAPFVVAISLFTSVAQAQETDPDSGTGVEGYQSATITIDDNETVPLSGTHKWATATHCSIRMATVDGQGEEKNDLTVVLVNPTSTTPSGTAGHLIAFGGASPDGTLTLTLPKSGDPVDFSITGVNGSVSVGDAKIEAHKDSSAGELLTYGTATVWWLHAPSMVISSGGGQYGFYENPPDSRKYILTTTGGAAVSLSSGIMLEPGGVSSPSINKIELSLVQNLRAGSARTRVYGGPKVLPGMQGDTVNVLSQYVRAKTHPTDVTDAEGNSPLYGGSGVPLSTGVYEAVDTPSTPDIAPTQEISVISNGGTTTPVEYQLATIDIDDKFRDWCVLHNKDLNQNDLQSVIQAMAEADWNLQVHVQGGAPTTATVGTTASTPPASSMTLTADPNQMGNTTGVESQGQVGDPITLTVQ